MSEAKETGDKKTLSVSQGGRLGLKPGGGAGGVRQNVSGGRGNKTVQVEVRRKRGAKRDGEGAPAADVVRDTLKKSQAAQPKREQPRREEPKRAVDQTRGRMVLPRLTDEEKTARQQALVNAKAREAERARQEEIEAKRRSLEEERMRSEREEQAKALAAEEARKQAEVDAARKAVEDAKAKAEAEAERIRQAKVESERRAAPGQSPAVAAAAAPRGAPGGDDADARGKARKGGGKTAVPTPARPSRGKGNDRRRSGKLTISQALDGPGDRQKSLAATRRRREREKRTADGGGDAAGRVVRDVTVPEVLTVAELANRMAVRGSDVIKSLMKMGVMATINQSIDADTAELIVEEFGHRIRRVSDADVEVAISAPEDDDALMVPRPAVVTVMGHVDHGKTSVLDALRKTDVVSREAGGITQHIGAYQITTDSGQKVTFLDTPGHAAFTSMRARGAKITDIVVLVVSADDSVMPQTIEAINHAKAANVPIIIAINKIDKPDAAPEKVKQDLLQHSIIVEEMGGEEMAVEISALKGTNLDKLIETILLQAELLELKANPERAANGTVVEAQLEQGRGAVATVLLQGGTLKTGDIFVCGATWGRVRALIDDQGNRIDFALPAQPVEVLGFHGAPEAGDEFTVVDDEAKAREVAEFRARRTREQLATQAGRGTLEQMLSAIKEGKAAEVPILIKGDVHGSVEAIINSAEKLSTNEVKARILHAGVGGITETDVTLAKSAGAVIFGFNARPNRQAREAAERDGVDIRYYNVIYELTDDLKAMMSGMLAPEAREITLGMAEVREVFNITKVGKIAGCLVIEGVVKKGAGYRQLRDGIVLHEGKIATLKHYKEDVSEVRQGSECGMSFANHQDIQEKDQIEVYHIEEIARSL